MTSSLLCPSSLQLLLNPPNCRNKQQQQILPLKTHRLSLSFPESTRRSCLRSGGRMASPRAEAATVTIEKGGVKIVRNPPESKLAELGVRNWPKWGCPPSKFPWTYSAKETCYILEGKVKVYPDGSDEVVEVGAGDLVVFPEGMSCTWDVSAAIDKHYKFE